eukprot:GHUV01026203.1.p1 GENE.GHUV01026203.1~~GHUV01026203.1.p1  ORF type:complete len:123 (+),score=14.81 GHUV01026203.1:545-913(+)
MRVTVGACCQLRTQSPACIAVANKRDQPNDSGDNIAPLCLISTPGIQMACSSVYKCVHMFWNVLQEKGLVAVPLLSEGNLVDAVWGSHRPQAPTAPLRVHPLQWAGSSIKQKLAEVTIWKYG